MKPLFPVVLILSLLWILGGSYYLNNKFCTKSMGFSVSDGKAFSTKSPSIYKFDASKANLKSNADMDKSFKSVAKYLKENVNRHLSLSGIYTNNEKNNTTFDNLGIARAESIKKSLVKKGAPETSISTSGVHTDNSYLEGTLLNGGVNFLFKESGDAASSGTGGDAAAATTAAASTEPGGISRMILYFDGKSTDIEMTSAIKDHLGNLMAYIKDNPGSKVMVTGHTDSKLSKSSQKKVSLKRADKVRRLIRDFGFSSGQVDKAGLSSSEPLESNDTEEGRAKNNRVEIFIAE